MDSRAYLNRRAYVVHDALHALAACEHGLTRADCDLCTRYADECDLGGCTSTAELLAVAYRDDSSVGQKRLICRRDSQFARDLGLVLVEFGDNNLRPAYPEAGCGTVAHTADDKKRRYFEPHGVSPDYEYHARGEVRKWDELISPRWFEAGCGVRP